MQISHFFFLFETAPWATLWYQSFLTSLNVADWENKHHCHVWKVKAEKCLICRAIHFDFHLAAVTEDTWTTAVGIIRRPKQTCFVGWLDSCSVKEIHAHKIKKYEDQIFCLTLFWLTVPGSCFHKKVTPWVSVLWRTVQGLAAPTPVLFSLSQRQQVWLGIGQHSRGSGSQTGAWFPCYNKKHRKRFTLFS